MHLKHIDKTRGQNKKKILMSLPLSLIKVSSSFIIQFSSDFLKEIKQLYLISFWPLSPVLFLLPSNHYPEFYVYHSHAKILY